MHASESLYNHVLYFKLLPEIWFSGHNYIDLLAHWLLKETYQLVTHIIDIGELTEYIAHCILLATAIAAVQCCMCVCRILFSVYVLYQEFIMNSWLYVHFCGCICICMYTQFRLPVVITVL